MMQFLYLTDIFLTAAAAAALGVGTLLLRESNRERWESLPRNRNLAFLPALLGLIWCIPHTRAIAFDWMVPLLWPMAFIFAAAAYWLLDYLLSRTLGGLMILTAYFLIHGAFEFHAPLAGAVTAFSLAMGTLGICLAGKPCRMRDLMRLCAARRRWRQAIAGGWFLTALVLALSGALQLAGRGGAA